MQWENENGIVNKNTPVLVGSISFSNTCVDFD